MPSPAPAPSSALLLGYPLRLWHRQQALLDDLMREMQLLLLGRQVEPGSAPARLVEIAHGLVSRYGAEVDEMRRVRQEAYDEGLVTMDVAVPLVPESEPFARAFLAAFAEVDEFCRDGQLLLLPTPDDLVTFREWTMGEVIAQARGEEPTPWTGPLE